MKLYLVQHARALTKEQNPERPLSPGGREDARRIAGVLQQAGVRLWRIRHSGKARAQETADIIGAALQIDEDIEAMAGLAPNDAVTGVVPDLAGWDADVMLVGHMPFVARLAAYLLGEGSQERPVLAFEPGAVACLERTPPDGWQLVWMLSPALVRGGAAD
ncbi:MAG TPA: phosphohistidine phosphatase SixA [Gammaproteobacteria bacterium]|nr:phosphohistidine phosphatase SixA [Gammaproteobacteria bacterium]